MVPDSVRTEVAARAGDRCEYCHLPIRGQVATFPVDHITPRTAGGTDDLSNLALACPRCNGHKWAATDGRDPATGQPVRLFNPAWTPGTSTPGGPRFRPANWSPRR
jgi:5-methylcytosine-specific restriction endonuclease McrA